MTYIYDILLNFQNEYYDFFEWNVNDKITHIKKTPVFKISDDDLLNIKNYKVQFPENFLKQIYNKTQVFKKYDINIVNYMCIFCSENLAIGIKMNKKGEVIGRSSLLIDESEEVLEGCRNNELVKIEFTSNKNKQKPEFHTRKEFEEGKMAIKKLQHLLENDEASKLNYLFFECFGKKETDINKSFNKIKKEIYKYEENYHKINEFLKLISQK